MVETSGGASEEATGAGDAALPQIETGLSEEDVVDRLSTMARRGKLPGFEAGGRGGLFSVTAFGTYFDRVLVGEAEGGAEGVTVRFRTELPLKMPLIIAAVFVFTVWPGVWMTDSMMATYWGWYGSKAAAMPWLTYAWYLPLTVVPLALAYRGALAKSNAAALASSRELIGKMAKGLGGRVA